MLHTQHISKHIRLMMMSLCLIILSISIPTSAQVIVPGVSTNPEWLSIDFHRVNVNISDQIATTEVSMQFTNNGEQLAEGTFIFPLPKGAAVDELIMTIDGLAIEAKILRAEEARAIYDEIVRQYRDPALLEYIGQDVIQANVFPIPPNESRKIDIRYGQLIEPDNGLYKYVYPLHATANASRIIDEMSIRVQVNSNEPITNVYSPTHPVALSRPNDNEFTAGFERSFFSPDDDYTLFWGVSRDEIGLNMLSYRESALEDGFFLLMVQPPLTIDADRVQPKDVVIVIDQSGSMDGQKWEQARDAALYVLDNLNPRDRFNVVAFSTGWRVYGNQLLDASEAEGARRWVSTLYPEGGTDIEGALSTALDFADSERPLSILFMTDGLASEGIQETDLILESLNDDAPNNARIFTFGVGDDVDTFLLDAIVRDFKGAGSYVRPSERIDEEVASLYNKISAPVMTNIDLQIDGATTELLYPTQLADLFAGEQLTLVGRFRNSADTVNVALTGIVDGQQQTLTYEASGFADVAGGNPFIARLWATRRIGDLLNTIRLNGESDELVDSVVNLSIRYGIITPYTSFLIEEDDILSQQGRERALDDFASEAEELADTATGASAVDAADTALNLQNASAPSMPNVQMTATALAPVFSEATPMPTGGAGGSNMGVVQPASVPMDMDETAEEMDMEDDGIFGGESQQQVNPIQYVGAKTFILQDGIWTDTTYMPDSMTPVEVEFLSDAYFDLLSEYSDATQYFAIGEQVIVVLDGVAYQVTSN